MIGALIDYIFQVISDQTDVNWLIVKDFSIYQNDIQGLEIGAGLGSNVDLPFMEHQGYFTITDQLLDEFTRDLPILIDQFKHSEVKLSNLYMLILRTGFSNSEIDLPKQFLDALNENQRRRVFNTLLLSLNSQYYTWSSWSRKSLVTAKDWLDLFQVSSSKGGFSDPIPDLLALLPERLARTIGFDDVVLMAPLVRAFTISWYGLDIVSGTKRIDVAIQNNPNEIAFLTATLLDFPGPDPTIPGWLDKNFIKQLVDVDWKNSGVFLFRAVFDEPSYGNPNPIWVDIRQYFCDLLIPEMTSEAGDVSWIETLDFPQGFMSLFSLLDEQRLLNKCSDRFAKALADKVVLLFDEMIESFPKMITRENPEDPLKMFKLAEPKYQLMLPYLLIFINSIEKPEKALKHWLLAIKPHFYGGWRMQDIAIKFSEFFILLLLSEIEIESDKDIFKISRNAYHDLLVNSVLIPYIHLSERSNYIWDSEERNVGLSDLGLALINQKLNSIRLNSIDRFKKIMDIVESVKVATWPFENDSPLEIQIKQ